MSDEVGDFVSSLLQGFANRTRGFVLILCRVADEVVALIDRFGYGHKIVSLSTVSSASAKSTSEPAGRRDEESGRRDMLGSQGVPSR
jgi:hypothetical protein